jgi:hypothetical protein
MIISSIQRVMMCAKYRWKQMIGKNPTVAQSRTQWVFDFLEKIKNQTPSTKKVNYKEKPLNAERVRGSFRA